MLLQNKNCNLISLKEILSSSEEFIIPMYQRNYDWSFSHVGQLIQDIYESAKYPHSSNYYIGTLVTYLRDDNNYEVVDGQQRLTSLHIIMCALKHEVCLNNVDCSWYKKLNLKFEYRDSSNKSLHSLFVHDSIDDLYIDNILEVYKDLVENLLKLVKDINSFCEFFFNHVKIALVTLPKDTDLNHYFEIMNNRGEQLEKHEILKALLLSKIQNEDSKKLKFFKIIWDACSNMNSIVQTNFEVKLRRKIFTEKLDEFYWNSFDDLFNACQDLITAENTSYFSIDDIYKHCVFNSNENSVNYIEEKEKFNSVINFPNFLLQVLKVKIEKDIPLDDKRLLDVFISSVDLSSTFVKDYILILLRLRFYFDKFVIKRLLDSDTGTIGEWKILTIKESQKSYETVNTFSDNAKERQNVMLELMFHVSLPSQNYKHWLTALLLFIYKQNGNGDYLNYYLENLAKAYILDHFLANDAVDYFQIIFKNGGKCQNICPEVLLLPRYTDGIDVFIFNYLDYCLWKDGILPEFKFTFRSSIEHLYPQHPLDGVEPLEEKYLHNFGNLCLISRSKNSRLSNFSPKAKVDYYKNNNYDSVKQKIMMDLTKDRGWDSNTITKHEKDMIEVLKKYLKPTNIN